MRLQDAVDIHAGCCAVNRISLLPGDLRQQLYALLQAQKLEDSGIIDRVGSQLAQRRSVAAAAAAAACEASDVTARISADGAALAGNPFLLVNV